MTAPPHCGATRAYLAIAVAVLGFTASPAHADMATADKNACLNCHAMAKKVVGPAFKDIAIKYRGKSDAETYLAQKIALGSSGVWGAVPMPGMPQVPPAEVKAMVQWILSQP